MKKFRNFQVPFSEAKKLLFFSVVSSKDWFKANSFVRSVGWVLGVEFSSALIIFGSDWEMSSAIKSLVQVLCVKLTRFFEENFVL